MPDENESSKPSEQPEKEASGRAAHLAPYKFKPGHSGNPRGRPKSVRERVAEMTRQGQDMLECLHSAVLGTMDGIRPRDQIEASKILMERLWGKPVETQVLVDATSAAAEGAGMPPDALELLARAMLPKATVITVSPHVVDAPDAIPVRQIPETPEE